MGLGLQPEFMYATLILPSLFALTLVGEGVHKLIRHESGWVPLGMGLTFISIVVSVYVALLWKP